MNNNIEALPVQRDKYGYWTHPGYAEIFTGRDHVPTAEFDSEMTRLGLDYYIEYRDEDEVDPLVDGCDISAWNPESPGTGWFIGSIHDTEDGAVCIWLRKGASNEQ